MSESHGKDWHLIIVAGIIAIGFVISAYLLGNSFVKARVADNITVTGSAKQQIKSDLATWNGFFSATAPQLTGAYEQLTVAQAKVKAYLIEKGVPENEIVFNAINTSTRNEILPSGQYTNKIESYELSQNVSISSADVDKITEISRQATELINQGVQFQSNPPQYFYTKIADLKIEMIGLATQDAFKRAEQIASNTNGRVGSLRVARMGVFQITPLYSNEISDYGINDTSSLEKEITAVMNCDFEIK